MIIRKGQIISAIALDSVELYVAVKNFDVGDAFRGFGMDIRAYFEEAAIPHLIDIGCIQPVEAISFDDIQPHAGLTEQSYFDPRRPADRLVVERGNEALAKRSKFRVVA